MFESGGSMRPESSGSPIAPSRIAEIVIPTWTVEMKRTGSSISRSAVRAPRPPRSARSSSRLRRAVTSAYSAVTKIAFPSTRRKTMTMRRGVLTPPLGPRSDSSENAPEGAQVLGGWSSTIDQAAV